MSTENYYAIDIGGTAIKLGIVSANGHVLVKSAIQTDNSLSFDAFVNTIQAALLELAAKVSIEPVGIGIGVPGYADPETGRLVNGSGNVPVLKEASLPSALSKLFNTPVVIDNDGVCAAIGELEYGIGREIDSFVLITLGTGIGGMMIVNREPLIGADGKPPEIGAIVINPRIGDARKGIQGSFEDLAGAKAIIRSYAAVSNESITDLNMNVLRERALEGEPLAIESYATLADHCAHAIGTIVNLTSLEHCVIGGGVSRSGDFLIDQIKERLPRYTWPLLCDKTQLHIAQTSNDAGLIGAMSVYRSRLKSCAQPMALIL